jgi:Protein of unknown function (DUF4012)
MRLRIWLIIAAIPLVYVIVLGAHIAVAAVHARSYFSSLGGEYNRAVLSQKSSDLASDINHVFTDLSVPGVKQIAGALGVDFTPIREEAVALIKESSWLAGADAPKSYLIAFQNSAEARGTGGIMGAYAVVQADRGKIKVLSTGSNAKLKSLQQIPISMPSEYFRVYGSDPAIWQNSNMSAHFPYAAEIWLALWKRQFNENLDGVVTIDPIAISHVLKATGPITLPNGEKVTSENVVQKTLSTAYARFANDVPARKNYLLNIMNATFQVIQTGKYSKFEMLKALLGSIQERRLLIYSKDLSVEQAISQTKLGGSMNANINNEFRAYVINTDASKLDYYLKRGVKINSLSCGVYPTTQIEFTVKNSVSNPGNLPDYVLGKVDKGKFGIGITGIHEFEVFIEGPVGSSLVSAKRSSRPGSPGGLATERGRPLLAVAENLRPNEEETITAIFKGGHGKLSYVDQPLVIPSMISILKGCSNN